MPPKEPQDAPRGEVTSGPTPSFPVRRSATIPAMLVDEKGVVHGDDWPLNTTQQVNGVSSDGSRVFIGSSSTQSGPNEAPRVTGSSISVSDANGNVLYSAELTPNGAFSGTGALAKGGIDKTAVGNIAELFDNVTDKDQISGALLDTTLDVFRKAAGIVRQ